MDTPKPVASRGRRVAVIATIVLLVALAAWFAYTQFAPKPLTAEQRKQLIIDQVAADSKPVSPEVRAAVTQQFTKDQTKADKQPDLSAAQKAAIIQNVAGN